jgi:hypothetical protein
LSEQWRPVPGYEGFYEVSDLGRVRSLVRTVMRGDGKPMRVPERVLAPGIVKNGYHAVVLCKPGGSKKMLRCARLVLEAFVGLDPDRPMALHNDGVNTNDRLSNLRWGTPKENTQDGILHGTIKTGSQSPAAKLSREQVLAVRALNAGGKSGPEIIKIMSLDVCVSTVCRILNRQSYSDI